MLEHYCDALIVGTDLSGLITGAFLARRGLTVHVLDLNSLSGNARAPDPLCVAHLHSKLFRSILGRLNIPEPDIQAISSNELPLQVIFPKKRIDIWANPSLFYEELEREFPEQSNELRQYYENLTSIKHKFDGQQLYSLLLPTTFKERRALKKFVRKGNLDMPLSQLSSLIKEDPNLNQFMMSQLKLVTTNHTDNPFAFQIAELLNPSEGEIFSVKGGHNALKKIFIDRIEHHEGAYRPKVNIDTLLYRDGIFEGAKLAGNEGTVLARYLIWNTHLRDLPALLPKQWRFRKLKKSIARLTPKAHWFTAIFEIPNEFIPPPMKSNLILIQDEARELSGSNFIYLQIHPKDEAHSYLVASYLWNPESLTADDDSFLKIHEQIAFNLDVLFPFAKDQLRYVFPKKQNLQNADTLFPLDENDFEIFRASAKNHVVYANKPRTIMDLFPLSYKTAAPNLFLTGPEILGSLGYEGKYILGLKVTDLIWEDVKKGKKWAMKIEKRIA